MDDKTDALADLAYCNGAQAMAIAISYGEEREADFRDALARRRSEALKALKARSQHMAGE